MSSRSLGFARGLFVSQGKSQPESCFLIRSGSSVRKRMRPRSCRWSARFSTPRVKRELDTLVSFPPCDSSSLVVQGSRHAASPTAVLYRAKLSAPEASRFAFFAVPNWTWQFFQPAPGKNILELAAATRRGSAHSKPASRGCQFRNGPPEKSVTRPPASSTISTPAAVSQGLRLNSQNPS